MRLPASLIYFLFPRFSSALWKSTNSWRASRPPGTGQHPPATPSLWKTSGEWDGAAAPAPPRPAALQPLPTPRGVSPLTPERYRGTISPPTAWDLPQHHHDRALAARHHHQPLPDHQSGRDDHAEVQHLVVQLGGGGGKRGPVRLRGPVPGRAEPARCDPPGPGPTRFPTHTLPPPRFGTCRLFMRRTSSRKSSDSIASPDRGGCTARPAPLPLPAPLLPPPRRFRPPHRRFRPRPLREAAKGRPWRPGPRTTRRPAPLDAFICNTSK